MSIVSIRGERPPCTHRTAPVSLLLEPLADEVAPVPAGPVREGAGAMGDEFGCEALLD